MMLKDPFQKSIIEFLFDNDIHCQGNKEVLVWDVCVWYGIIELWNYFIMELWIYHCHSGLTALLYSLSQQCPGPNTPKQRDDQGARLQ